MHHLLKCVKRCLYLFQTMKQTLRIHSQPVSMKREIHTINDLAMCYCL